MSRVFVVLAMLIGLTSWAPAAQAEEQVVLGGVVVQLEPGTTQVLTVNRSRGWRADAIWWELVDGAWVPIAATQDGRIGKRGLVVAHKRRQGSNTTPLGTFRLLDAFGMGAGDAAYKVGYRQVQAGDYWVQDNRSPHYNRYRARSEGGFRWWLKRGINSSENLITYRTQYEWSINTSFNIEQVRRRGAGIFVHVNGRGPTAGCVSVPRDLMQLIMTRIDSARVPVVAIGR